MGPVLDKTSPKALSLCACAHRRRINGVQALERPPPSRSRPRFVDRHNVALRKGLEVLLELAKTAQCVTRRSDWALKVSQPLTAIVHVLIARRIRMRSRANPGANETVVSSGNFDSTTSSCHRWVRTLAA